MFELILGEIEIRFRVPRISILNLLKKDVSDQAILYK